MLLTQLYAYWSNSILTIQLWKTTLTITIETIHIVCIGYTILVLGTSWFCYFSLCSGESFIVRVNTLILNNLVLYPVRGSEWNGLGGSHGCPGRLWDRFLWQVIVCTVLCYYRSGRLVIKIGPNCALGSHEIRPIHSTPSLGQGIVGLYDFLFVRRLFLGVRHSKNRVLKFLF